MDRDINMYGVLMDIKPRVTSLTQVYCVWRFVYHDGFEFGHWRNLGN